MEYYGAHELLIILQMTMRPELYAKQFQEVLKPDFQPQAVYEPQN